MSAGVKTPNLNTVSVADSVIVNRDGSTAIQAMTSLAQQLNADLSIAVDREAAVSAAIKASEERRATEAIRSETAVLKAGTEAVRDAASLIAATKAAYRATTITAAIAQGLAALTVGDTFSATGDDVDYFGIYVVVAGPAATEIVTLSKSNVEYNRLMARSADADAHGGTSPLSLFASGEGGFWLDLFASDGVLQATKDLSGNGNDGVFVVDRLDTPVVDLRGTTAITLVVAVEKTGSGVGSIVNGGDVFATSGAFVSTAE